MTTTYPKLTKAQKRKDALNKHYILCGQLGAITGSKFTGKKISTELFKIEKLAHEGATAYNNGEKFQHFDFRSDQNAWENFSRMITLCVKDILGSIPLGFFVNGDSRGYALKIEKNIDSQSNINIPLEQDWGGFQILSPEIK